LAVGDIRDSERKALTNEFYRGLMQGAMEENIKLQFSYFTSEPTPEEFQRQLKEIENYDFIIFSGLHFRDLMAKTALKMLADYFKMQL
jgi:hypothetical protein